MKIRKFMFFVLFGYSCQSVVMAESIFNGVPFSGFYVGVQGGYGHANNEVTDNAGLGLTLDLGSSGGMYGFLGGWGTTLPSINPNLYVGIEGQYNFMDRDGELSIGVIPASIEWETDDMWSIGGRLGYLLSGNTMTFVRVAYASLDSEISISPGGIAAADVDTLDGIQLGLGFEHHLGRNFTLRGEYVYSDYGSADINVSGIGDIAEVDVTSSEVHIGLSYSFYQFPWQSQHSSGNRSTASTLDFFSGFYVGVQGGYGHANNEVTDNAGLGLTLDLGSSGGMYGFLGGWGTTLPSINPNLYVGIEGQYNFMDRDGELSIGVIPASIEWETDDMWSIGGRLGYLLSGNTMTFVRVAYASLDSEISISPGGIAAADVDTLDGIQLGLGFEHHLGRNFTLRGEYVYSDYGSADINVSGIGDIAEVDVTSSEVHIGLSYNF